MKYTIKYVVTNVYKIREKRDFDYFRDEIHIQRLFLENNNVPTF